MTTVHLARYAAARADFINALINLARETGAAATAGLEPAELLELQRLVLHRAVDAAIDAEELRRPSPLRLIARAPAYLDLLHAVRGEGLSSRWAA